MSSTYNLKAESKLYEQISHTIIWYMLLTHCTLQMWHNDMILHPDQIHFICKKNKSVDTQSQGCQHRPLLLCAVSTMNNYLKHHSMLHFLQASLHQKQHSFDQQNQLLVLFWWAALKSVQFVLTLLLMFLFSCN